MINAFAPGRPRGGDWVWAAIMLLALPTAAALAQGPGSPAQGKGQTKGAAPKPDPKADPKAKAAAPAAAEEEAPEEKKDPVGPSANVELFKDPRAAAALAIFKPTQPPRPQITSAELNSVKSMSAGLVTTNRETLSRYVQAWVAELTSTPNLKAIISPAPNSANSLPRGLERAMDQLIDPILTAKNANQAGFLAEYNKILLETLPPILENNLFSRLDAMILLGTAGDRNALPVFLKQIGNANQVIWVKHWALRGISNATKMGAEELPAQTALDTAKAISSFLDTEKNLPWPVLVRTFETLGAVRSPSVDSLNVAQVPLALLALKSVSDPAARIEVRAWASWALGMFRIPSQASKYNYALVAYHIGRVAEALGNKIGAEYDLSPESFDRAKDQAVLYTGLLLYQVGGALSGDPTRVRESGLLNVSHPNAAAGKKAATDIDKFVKAVEKSAVELVRAGGSQQKSARENLKARVFELKAYLDKNPPADTKLIPGGPDFPPAGQKVAGGPAAK